MSEVEVLPEGKVEVLPEGKVGVEVKVGPGPGTRSGVPVIGEAGRAARELPAGRPPAIGDSADHELSECSFPGVEVRAASVRGLLHRYREEPRQDRFSLVHDESSDTLIVSVCDGVGSMGRSHEAAGFVAGRMPLSYRSHGNWPDAIIEVNGQLAAFADEVAKSTADDGDPYGSRMATTFVGAAVSLGGQRTASPGGQPTTSPGGPRTASIAWTDDSTVWLLADGEWTKLTADPDRSDSTVYTGGVRALPHPEPRFRTIEVPVDGGALFVMSDGVGVPLEGAREVRDTLAGWWAAPPDVFTFAGQVGFARKSHMDDRTVVGIWFDQPTAQVAQVRAGG